MYIAIDTAGGDYAPRRVVHGALVAARHLGFGLILVGNKKQIESELGRYRDLGKVDLRILDTPEVIEMVEAPATALRKKPKASIRLVADLVARGDASAFFSSGHTGATVLAARSSFGLLPGVDRAALATMIPTLRHGAVLLDSGANIECRPQHLVQFAVMGRAYANLLFDISEPKVGLLSIGEEATKGNELICDTHRLLKSSGLNFVGNVEAADLYKGYADVIVCDGFTGNIALKISEGLVAVVEELLHEELKRTFTTRFGYLLSRRAFRRFSRRVDYSEYGGALLLGVRGLCIVGHGRSSSKAVRNAVAMAYHFADQGFVEKISKEINSISGYHSSKSSSNIEQVS